MAVVMNFFAAPAPHPRRPPKVRHPQRAHRQRQLLQQHQQSLGVHPHQHLAVCLLHARPCRLLIDGHNLLPKLKPLIGASYFKVGEGPTAKARALLIERVKTLTAQHPLLEADIWFDSPDDQHWSETDNLRVWFSGGKGNDRADDRILESLQSEVYRVTQTTRLVVTEDRELLAQAHGKGAIGVSPLEMWAMLN